MEKQQTLQRNAGFLTFFLSGVCAISSGVVVSLLQETYGFDYSMTGTLLSLMSIGNLIAGFAAGILPGKIGMKPTILILTAGYGIGYLCMGLSGWIILLMLSFFLVGIAKGSTINICTILVGDNSKDRTIGMNLMHSCYAMGALLCPFLIAFAVKGGSILPMMALSVCGLLLWLTFARTPMETRDSRSGGATDWSFLKSKKFWLLTGLLFCQNAAETSVTGWMVTYFKGSGIITGAFSPYTVTIMWGATLIARLLIAFWFPLKNAYSAMINMSVGCIIFYIGLMLSGTQSMAILLLFAFAFAMAGMNPTAVASAGKMTNVTSMGVMLPAASSGAILMPWLIGIIAEHAGIGVGMASNIVPCVGMLLFSVAVKKLQ
ncbi:MAG: MFS transporter [Lachnospiraceae bacterium]